MQLATHVAGLHPGEMASAWPRMSAPGLDHARLRAALVAIADGSVDPLDPIGAALPRSRSREVAARLALALATRPES